MATVSEVGFCREQVGFCACCGLRRPLGRINLSMRGETVRCIDCFFGPPDDGYAGLRFFGEAIYARHDNAKVNFGQTGDVVRDWEKYYFEPHGNYEGRIEISVDDVTDMNVYDPKRHSVYVPEESDE